MSVLSLCFKGKPANKGEMFTERCFAKMRLGRGDRGWQWEETFSFCVPSQDKSGHLFNDILVHVELIIVCELRGKNCFGPELWPSRLQSYC